ncbi:MAG: hypothetical protein LBN37_06330 [Bacteroidales bacterium]|nr:hypothetical protein [Bacteroidales bacterium]
MIAAHGWNKIFARAQANPRTCPINTSARMQQNFLTYATDGYSRMQSTIARVCNRACARMQQAITLSINLAEHVCSRQLHTRPKTCQGRLDLTVSITNYEFQIKYISK